MEWNGMEWNGMEWKWNGWNKWNKWNGMEWKVENIGTTIQPGEFSTLLVHSC